MLVAKVYSISLDITGPLACNATMMTCMMDYDGGDYMMSDNAPQIQLHMGGIVFGGDPGGELNDRILRSSNLHHRTVSTNTCSNAPI